MKQPVFSIILCNYNYGRYITEAIKSVLNQTYTDFELIIVDDGSTDNSREVIEAFSDARITSVFKENGGQASAFNAGFEIAKGELIAFLDSDDWWEKEKLEQVFNYYKASNAKIGLIQHLLYDELNGDVKALKDIIPTGDVLQEIKNKGGFDFFIPTSALVVTKYVCKHIFPIPKEIWFSADAYIMRTSITEGIVLSIPEFLGYHRLHEASFTSGILKDLTEFFNLIIPHLNKYYQVNGIKYQYPDYGKKPIKVSKPAQIKKVLTGIYDLVFKW